ncbi:hypothetical protein DE167_004992 [Clostridium beijerinckii]|uniref:Uncharacterized protein n=1 Tax=Clostridium beijerinckii TaxID=1520 RepID=A0AAX0B1J6_CLOBE|nr:hypothetical protein [Clostridium beijerinckii]NYC74426.1 hypothetical protein [Clostridium beijerinckii]
MEQFRKYERDFQIDNTFLKFLESKKIKYTKPEKCKQFFIQKA